MRPRGRARLLLLAAALACGGERGASDVGPGLRTRVYVDRSEARVGDRIGVTIEVEAPPGFSLALPSAPRSAQFVTESLAPGAARAGDRQRQLWLWTLRPRAPGDHALPLLELPLLRPDGTSGVLRVGGAPLLVRSVRSELPQQQVFFDLAPAPPPAAGPLPWLVAGTLALGLALFALLRPRAEDAASAALAPDPAELARAALRALEDAAECPDPREQAHATAAALWSFVERHYAIDVRARTVPELPDAVDPDWSALLGALARARFARRPEPAALARARARAQELLRDVAEPPAA